MSERILAECEIRVLELYKFKCEIRVLELYKIHMYTLLKSTFEAERSSQF